jgi:hypothetical protein
MRGGRRSFIGVTCGARFRIPACMGKKRATFEAIVTRRVSDCRYIHLKKIPVRRRAAG